MSFTEKLLWNDPMKDGIPNLELGQVQEKILIRCKNPIDGAIEVLAGYYNSNDDRYFFVDEMAVVSTDIHYKTVISWAYWPDALSI